ncbi:uncharacterized protein [Aristolochia californica]|uniref:uncharacterized protein n=1 Tax=Aristolochia californica TaxID=171875 RepID=UPI0035DEF5F5
MLSALIDGYVKDDNYKEALAINERMQIEGPKANDVTMVSVLCACAYLGAQEQGRKMQQYVVHNGGSTQNGLADAAIELFHLMGLVDVGQTYFHDMRRVSSVEPNLKHYACMVAALNRVGQIHEALEFIETMPVEPTASMLGAILTGRNNHGTVELGACINKFLLCIIHKQINAIERVVGAQLIVVGFLTACPNLGTLHQGKLLHTYIKVQMISSQLLSVPIEPDLGPSLGVAGVPRIGFIYTKLVRALTSIATATCGFHTDMQSDSREIVYAKNRDGALEEMEANKRLISEDHKYFNEMLTISDISTKFAHFWCMANLYTSLELIQEAEATCRFHKDMQVRAAKASIQSKPTVKIMATVQVEDVTILEVGLEGKFDATNEGRYYHMETQGYTLGQIAGEQARILKDGVAAFSVS